MPLRQPPPAFPYRCITSGKLTQTVSIAYWIAFGPHGPRAMDPPGSGARVAWGVAIGLAASVGIFGVIRFFAKPVPYTMSQEYQEQSNEFLIVSRARNILISSQPRLTHPLPEPKIRPFHWYHLRGLQGQGHGPVPSQGQQRINSADDVFSFVLEAGVTHGDVSVCKMALGHRSGWGLRGDSREIKPSWCKYCTTTTEPESSDFEICLLYLSKAQEMCTRYLPLPKTPLSVEPVLHIYHV